MDNEEPKENNETPNSNENNLISLENYDFSNKSKLINSPRSLNACLRLGIEISELYKISMDDFKQKYPDVRYLDKELLELRYKGENDFRKKTAEQAKEERNKIIEEEKNKKNEEKDGDKNNEEQNKDEDTIKWEKLIEKEKKGIEKIKKRQRQNIESLIEEQINKELLIKVTEVKEQLKREREEEAKKVR